ncbi:MAG: glycosyltransferase [Chloroflexota bacterium]|nr:glycosyltransferase [Chloroflexota bacterium]
MQRSITIQNTEFVILSFEGPDRYSMAGGLGVRVDNLAATLARMGYRTHLFFIGDPFLESVETRQNGNLVLHRMCQWISKYHTNGVYDAEDAKLYDFNESVPWLAAEQAVKPAVAQGKLVVILGEEWHTAEAMCRLSDSLHYDGVRDRVVMFWNANNTFSFHRINWGRLSYVTTITTVSKYMKHLMWRMGLNPLVIPNGIPRELLRKMDEGKSLEVREALGADLVLCKVARWDPDKRWNGAVETVAKLKERGVRTVLLARGGVEPHGQEVLYNARTMGLTVGEAFTDDNSFHGYLKALHAASYADVIDIKFHVPLDFLRSLYHASDAVLANSGHEPFGIVGLEAMAAGGIAFTGCTGEDYAIPFVNAFVLETPDPMEAVGYLTYVKDYPEEGVRIREAARRTARSFTWESAVNNLVSKLENQARMRGVLGGVPTPAAPQFALSKLPPELVATTMKRHY